MFDNYKQHDSDQALCRLLAFGEQIFVGCRVFLAMGEDGNGKRVVLDRGGVVEDRWNSKDFPLPAREGFVSAADLPAALHTVAERSSLLLHGGCVLAAGSGSTGMLLLALAPGQQQVEFEPALIEGFAGQVSVLLDSFAPAGGGEASRELDLPHLTERLLEILCQIDIDGVICSINPSAEMLLGYESGGLQGRNLAGLVHPEERRRVHEALMEGSSLGGFETELRWRHREGHYLHFDCRGVALGNRGRQQDIFYLAGRNISRRKRAEAEVRRLETWFQLVWKNSRDAMRLVDGAGTIVEVNDAYCCLVDKSREELVGSLYTVAYSYPDAGIVLEDYRQRFVTREIPSHLEVEVRLWNGKSRVFERSGSFFEVEGRTLLLTIYRDMTERRKREAELKDLNQALKQRAAHLGALTLQLTRVEQAERRRLAQAVHDHLQQLLVAARMTMERIRRRIPEGELADTAGEVEDLLTESIEASRSITVELSPPILHDGGLVAALEWLQRRMEQKHAFKVNLQVGSNAEPESEPLRLFLFQAVRELVFNCFKHAGVNEVNVSLDQSDTTRVRVVVEDQGTGFDWKGVRGNVGNRDCFGLFSLRERIDYIGGEMEIASSPGRGTRVVLTAPLEPDISLPAPEAPALVLHATDGVQEPQREDPAKRIRLLLVDDHKIMRQGLRELLDEQSDMLVVGEAANGLEGIRLAQELRPDVVVMDLAMPVMNGIEATRVLTAEFPQIKVVGLSMHMKEDMAQAMLEAGAFTYVTKATASETLSEAIRECVGVVRSED